MQKSTIVCPPAGLFLLLGAGMCVALVAWARGSALRKGTPYNATIEFPQACGITVGTPVRIRGVQVRWHCTTMIHTDDAV